MLTFLRKIRHSLIDSGSTTRYIYYAIGEIALVVIGILIALQINNWNEWKKDRIREQNTLIDLEDNLQRNIALTKEAILTIERINVSSETAIKSIGGELPYSDTMHFHFDQMTRSGSYLFELNTDGYESFKNIGFEIISSKKLKNEIISLFEVIYSSYEKDILVTNAMWGNNPFWWKDYFIADLELGMIPIDNGKLQGANDILNIATTLLRQRITLINSLRTVLFETSKVLRLIKDELSEG